MDVLQQLKQANPLRCEEAFGHRIEDWSSSQWSNAVAGETGELCNLIKKLERGDMVYTEDIAKEAADIVIYLDMLCQKQGIDLSRAIVNKFNEVSDKKDVPHIKIYYY